ncbi:hypothetical protein [Candidatus Marithrix sp. Canyon 246]|uniref:hypothetical protein n=1 Tax=Candidatus Marithrix sp. Canyon 246 TaxID=1827136 RepID=UPI00084A1ADB|nr:hypothetical protein [Candidatus Marithrix sp. Canyon 246]
MAFFGVTKGDIVLYFAIDSLIPEWVLEKLDLVAKLTLLENMPANTADEKITEFLGVEKYDIPPIPCQNAQLIQLPIGLSAYDIEGADRYVEVAQVLMSQLVEITEKLEGQNFSATYANSEDKIYIKQRDPIYLSKTNN